MKRDKGSEALVTEIGCSILPLSPDGRVLVSRRSEHKAYAPSCWETIGGGLEIGESPAECIVREVREELGCGIRCLSLFNVYVVGETGRRYVLIVFVGELDSQSLSLNPREIAEVRWVGEKEIGDLEFAPMCREKLTDYFSRCGQDTPQK